MDSAEVNNHSRIASAVIRSSIWAEDGGDVEIEQMGEGITALSVVNEYDGVKYYKRLYCAMDSDPLDGEPRSFLWESYNSEDVEFIPENGESLCELNSFVPSIENNMLKVELETSNGTKSTIRMALRTGGAAK